MWRADILAGLLLLMSGGEAVSHDHDVVAPLRVRDEVIRIENDPDPHSRYEAMRRMVTTLRSDSSFIVEEDIAALAKVLKDSSDLVRDRAAVALGLIGPQAIRAVPALRAALDEVACVRADQNSSFATAVALRRIGVVPEPPECIATPGYGLKPQFSGRSMVRRAQPK